MARTTSQSRFQSHPHLDASVVLPPHFCHISAIFPFPIACESVKLQAIGNDRQRSCRKHRALAPSDGLWSGGRPPGCHPHSITPDTRHSTPFGQEPRFDLALSPDRDEGEPRCIAPHPPRARASTRTKHPTTKPPTARSSRSSAPKTPRPPPPLPPKPHLQIHVFFASINLDTGLLIAV